MHIRTSIEEWPFAYPFTITGYTFTHSRVVVAEIESDGITGRGEACGVYYLNDTVEHAHDEVAAFVKRIDAPFSREELLTLLPAGGARNALDAALWDLQAQIEGRPVWQIAGLHDPHPVLTTYTLGADSPDAMVARARAFTKARALKLKLTGTDEDAARVRAVRDARPDVWIGVDGNQGFTRASLDALMPTLVDARVSLLEQPFARDRDANLEGLNSPIPVAADESAQDLDDLERLAGCIDVVNIKLDKCGGLTRGLQIAARARELGIKTMVGCMGGTSLAMATGFVLGQLCEYVDLDGPVNLAYDRTPSVTYDEIGRIFSPSDVWGAPTATPQPS
jgi:L-alanine-DL-glutamate epimerase-like enolase superfamily enzyme